MSDKENQDNSNESGTHWQFSFELAPSVIVWLGIIAPLFLSAVFGSWWLLFHTARLVWGG